MARIPVPEGYEGQAIVVCGTNDHHYGTSVADVELDDRRYARPLQIRSDEDGRYVGCGGNMEDVVREYLGVPAEDGSETCQVVKSDGEVCGRELPCQYHDDEES